MSKKCVQVVMPCSKASKQFCDKTISEGKLGIIQALFATAKTKSCLHLSNAQTQPHLKYGYGLCCGLPCSQFLPANHYPVKPGTLKCHSEIRMHPSHPQSSKVRYLKILTNVKAFHIVEFTP